MRLILTALLSIACLARADQEQPLSPEESLAHIQLDPGLQVELVAAEPEIFDPVAMAFDERGRLYVVEDRGYPSGPGQGQPPAGSVALLEDKDNDGHYETRHLFAEGFDFPNGVMCWNGGVLLTDAPNVYFLKDTDGDFRADLREVLLEGFSLGGSTQLHVSHPTLSLDNWIYFTNGLSGGEVGVAGHPEIPRVKMGNMDLRYHPLTHELQAMAGQAQFGLTFNDLNDKFVCSNRKHIEHVVLQPGELARNPNLQWSQTVAQIPEHGEAARIYAISQARTTAYAHAGTFTAACGIVVYRGTALGEGYYGNSFTCDPTGNLVHRDVLEAQGPTYLARRAEDGREFFASSDNWTRPVFLANGPDGALYVCDMYRQTIEHPVYLPKEVAEVTDFNAGKQHGRIYRVSGVGVPPAQSTAEPALPIVDAASPPRPSPSAPPEAFSNPADLVKALAHPNAWTRETAHRLLLESDERAIAIPLLIEMLDQGSPLTLTLSPEAGAREPEQTSNAKLHALYLLDAYGALTEAELLQALQDPAEAVREHAVKLARPPLWKNHPALEQAIAKLAQDPAPRVRFQVALALKDLDSVEKAPPLASILLQDMDDPWMRAAVLSSVSDVLQPFSQQVLATLDQEREGLPPLMDELGHMAAMALPAADTIALLQALKAGAQPFLAGALEGIASGKQFAGEGSALKRLREAAPEETRAMLDAALAQAGTLAAEDSQPLESREYALRILAHGDFDSTGRILVDLLGPQHVPEVQLAAVQALGKLDDPHVAEALTTNAAWGAFTTGVRSAALSVLLARAERIPVLLNAIESGAIPAWSVPPAFRSRLENAEDKAVQERAKTLFAGVKRPDRSQVYQEYKSVLELHPDRVAGREVFLKNCSTCHTYNDEGHQVGPDLTGLTTQPLESILLHVLDPNWLMEPGYENYVIETNDFESFSGLITAQTPSSVTIRQSMGVEQTIPRDNIERISATSLSMMPEELEKAMTREELRSLLGFLKGE